MKLNHILADNFQRLNLFDVDLSETVLHLFAGDNEAGKTSVQEAIRFALRGETVRVSKKGDYKLMIRDGAKSGTVAVTLDGTELVRDIKTGKMQTDAMEGYAAQLPKYLPYLLDSQHFAHTNGAKRRAFLLELTGTSTDPDNIARRMKTKGVHDKCIDQVKPLLRNSMDAGHKEATARASEARAQWVGLTGQARYGSQIAADWKPEPPEGYDPQALLDGEKGLTQLQEAIDTLNIKKGGLIAGLAEAREGLGNQPKGGVAFDLAELDQTIRDIETAKNSIESLEERRKLLNTEISNARERVPVPCCECGAMLRVSFQGNGVEVEPYKPMSEEALEKAQASILTVGCDISDGTRELKSLNEKAAGLARQQALAAGSGKKVSQADIDADQETLDTINLSLDDLNAKRTTLDERLAGLRTAAERIRDAGKIEERAQSLHRAVQAWGKCVDVLAPDGIPAEILSDTLRPVNDRLRNTANLTRWPQVTIYPDMEVAVEGRRYALLSESARWRADAAIADAISHLSGLGLLVLDRIDVLDIKNRGSLMRWLSAIDEEYQTILLFGTLKQLPPLPVTMSGHWIEAGEVVAQEVA